MGQQSTSKPQSSIKKNKTTVAHVCREKKLVECNELVSKCRQLSIWQVGLICCFSHLELNAVNDPHLLEEGGLAAFSSPKQQEFDLPAKGLSVLLQHPVNLLALVPLLYLLGAELEPEAPGAGPR